MPMTSVARQEPQQLVTLAQLKAKNQQELSTAMQRKMDASFYGCSIIDKSLHGTHLDSFVPHMPTPRPRPPSYTDVQSHEAYIARFGGDRARPNTSAFLNFYVLDGNGNRLNQLNPKNSGMLCKVGNHLFVIKLPYLMSKYRTQFFGLDKLTGGLHAMEFYYMTLITEKAIFMPQVSDILRYILQTHLVPSVLSYRLNLA